MERAFPNRIEAGRQLAENLEKYAGRDDVIVLGLPRGGVPVAKTLGSAGGIPIRPGWGRRKLVAFRF